MKRVWCWERLREGGGGDDRGRDGWTAPPTQWMWVWVSSGSWQWTESPGMLQCMGSQRIEHDWVTELNWNNHHKHDSICFSKNTLTVCIFTSGLLLLVNPPVCDNLQIFPRSDLNWVIGLLDKHFLFFFNINLF